ncbi:MAG: TlpA family protein disulfide reductase, partial [Chitinophagales bacterium]
MRQYLYFILTLLHTPLVIAQIQTGFWRGTLETPGGPLPFNFTFTEKDSQYLFVLHNGDESLATDTVIVTGEYIHIQLAVFHATLQAKILENGNQLSGEFQDYSRGDNYIIPFKATAGQSFRFFKTHANAVADISGKWATQFYSDTDSSFAIGVFTQNGNALEGTFLTETGDYRFLEGDVTGNQFFLSAFDGSHAFLFTGEILNDSLLQGRFFSGT